MANLSSAVFMVAEFIIKNELYNFKSLAEETQQKLINAYGKGFEQEVNQRLAVF